MLSLPGPDLVEDCDDESVSESESEVALEVGLELALELEDAVDKLGLLELLEAFVELESPEELCLLVAVVLSVASSSSSSAEVVFVSSSLVVVLALSLCDEELAREVVLATLALLVEDVILASELDISE